MSTTDHLTTTQLCDVLGRLPSPRVLVVGDVIVDRYVFGSAERISQEAPVPVFLADREEDRLGGAASVASMLAALDAQVVLAGTVAADAPGRRARQLLAELGIADDLVLEDPSGMTTHKIRYVGRAQGRHPQQMIRVDYEVRRPIVAALEERLLRGIEARLPCCDVMLVSDYAKGTCSETLLKQLFHLAAARSIRVLVDPARYPDYSRYAGATCLTPNRTETQLATGQVVGSAAGALRAGEHLRRQLGCEAMVVTLDKDGMALVHQDGRQKILPTRPREVYDVTGAGDMVLSVIGLCLAAGEDYEAAVALGNVAGGLEVEHLGVATLARAELLRDLQRSAIPAKVLPLAALLSVLAPRRRGGQRVVFTNGCFDILHAGHIRYLRQARELGDLLVVGLNSDDSVRRLKGPGRPVNASDARAEVLAALSCVDHVTIFEEDSSQPLIEAVNPDVLVKGADYTLEQVVGRAFVESQGGKVVLLPFVPNLSTTRILGKLAGEPGVDN